MTLDAPVSFAEAVNFMASKDLLPTTLDSAGIRQLGADILRASMISARTTNEYLLGKYRSVITDILNPTVETRADRVTETNPQGHVNVGGDVASARLKIKNLLSETGYAPAEGEAGTFQDLGSDARINLVLETNRDIARGFGWQVQGQNRAVLDAFPAQELVRVMHRGEPRDWPQRWRLNAAVVHDVDAARVLEETGRMIARKDSGIWLALGKGEDGSTDTLGNPFPPFAFNSGMGVRDIPYSEAVKLGVVKPEQQVQPQPVSYPQPPESN